MRKGLIGGFPAFFTFFVFFGCFGICDDLRAQQHAPQRQPQTPRDAVPSRHVAVVCPETFRAELEPWIRYRASQGYVLHVIEPDRDGTAAELRKKIRDLDAVEPLGFLLIVGDTYSSDPNVRTVPVARSAAKVIRHFGSEHHIASDNLYADRDGDELPELAVGRFSVQTPEQLRAVVRKVIRYECAERPGVWQRRINFIAGVGGFSPLLDRSIESAAKHILSRTIPAEYDVTLTQADWRSSYCPAPQRFRDTVLERMNEGSLFWVYMGHGFFRHLDRLHRGDGTSYPIFEQEDVRRVCCENGPPIAVVLACYAGALDTIEPCLAEELHRSEHGPVAVLASSRVAMPYGMSVFGIGLIEEVFGENCAENHAENHAVSENEVLLGHAVLRAKRKAIHRKNEPATPGRERPVRDMIDSLARFLDPASGRLHEQNIDHVHLFHLFGDPLLRLPRPKRIFLEAPAEIKNATTVSVRGRVAGLPEVPPQDGALRRNGDFGELVLELAVPKTRDTAGRPDRKTFPEDRRSMDEYDRIYERANDRVVVRKICRLHGTEFSLEIDLPRLPVGEYDLRAYHESETALALGSRKVTIR